MADDASYDDFGLGGYSPNQAWGARPTSHGIWGSLTGGNAYRRTGQINVPLPDGTVNQYPFATGGSGAGAMPVGDYTVNNYRDASTRQSQGLKNLGPGTFDLSNAYDPKVDRVRTELRLHAGSNDEYGKLLSQGCAVLPPSQWPAFAADLKAHLAANGGSTKFRVQQQDSAGPSVGAIPMPAGGPFEMPQPMVLGGPPQSSQAPQVRGSTAMAGMEDNGWGSLIGRFANGLENVMSSSLFNRGAGMAAAGGEGKNIAAGFLAGGEAATAASKNQFALQEARRKMEQMQLQDQYLQSLSETDPRTRGLNPLLLDMARNTRDPRLLQEAVQAKMAQDHRAYIHPADLALKQAQAADLNRREEPETIRVLNAARALAARGDTEGAQLLMNSIKGGDPISQAIGAAISRQFQQQPEPQSPIRPQSFNAPVQGADPNLVQVQTGGQQQDAPQQPTVNVPALGEMPRSKAEMLAFGLSMQGKGDAGKMIMEGVNATKLGKEAGNKNDETELQLTDAQARMRQIKSSFDPKFLSMATQGKMAWNQLLSKATGGQLSPKDQEELYRFATFRRDAAENLNIFLKDRSGAAVTEQELKRAQVELPNAGSGIFDGDDPVTFKAKMDRATEVGTLGIARRRMLREKGFNGAPWDSGISLDQMRSMINTRAKQIENQVRTQNPGIAKPVLDREVDARVKQEFGI